jgi:hypothetical protein
LVDTAPVLALEPVILAATDPTRDKCDIRDARRAVAATIRTLCGLAEAKDGKTLAEHIEEASTASMGVREAALLIVRCTNVQGLLPPNSADNQIERRVVMLVEKALPDFSKDFSIGTLKMTYEKYDRIAQIHAENMSMLTPLGSLTTARGSLLACKQEIQRALSRRIVGAYLSIYDFSSIRVELLALLETLTDLVDYPGEDFSERLNRAIELLASQKNYARQNITFFTELLLTALYNRLDHLVGQLRADAEDRFACHIRPRRADMNPIEKRYPLHERGRELQIHISLVNEGPGIAIDVTAEVITDTDAVHFHSSIMDLCEGPARRIRPFMRCPRDRAGN